MANINYALSGASDVASLATGSDTSSVRDLYVVAY